MSYSILLAIAAMIVVGLSDFFAKKAFDKGVNAIVVFFYSLSICVVFFGLWTLIESFTISLSGPMPLFSLLIGLILFSGTILALLALKTGDASIVVPITRMGFIVTALLAFIFIGEELTITRGAGILSAVAAIFFLSKKPKPIELI